MLDDFDSKAILHLIDTLIFYYDQNQWGAVPAFLKITIRQSFLGKCRHSFLNEYLSREYPVYKRRVL
jgi:hypothetical protein